MTYNRILFTGQSGIDIQESLNHLKMQLNRSMNLWPRKGGIQVAVFKLEKFIEDVFLADRKQPYRSSQDIWEIILNSPYAQLERWWRQACIALNRQIQVSEATSKASHHLSLISLHSVFYHGKTNEYISCIDYRELKKLSPDLIITLIDDIYDIHHRLQKPGKIFYDIAQNPLDEIAQLFVILDWRAKEILTTKIISKMITTPRKKLPFYVLAVKHPFATPTGLIAEKPTAYLSHPISEIRRLEEKQQKELVTDFLLELRHFSETLQDFFAFFLPTTIDEFRIQTQIVGEGKMLLPELKDRWDKTYYALPQENTLYSVSGFEGAKGIWDADYPSRSQLSPIVWDKVLTLLKGRIVSQVTVRDYMLVEQSDYLIVFRPTFNGNISGGVKEENDYHLTVTEAVDNFFKKKGSRSKIFVYCPKKDILSLLRRVFQYYFDRLRHAEVLRPVVSSEETSYFPFTEEVFEQVYTHMMNSTAHGQDIEDELVAIIKHTLFEGKRPYHLEYNNLHRLPVEEAQNIVPPGDTHNSALGGSDNARKNTAIKKLIVEPINKKVLGVYDYKESGIFETNEISASAFLQLVLQNLQH